VTDTSAGQTLHHPIFARMWAVMSAHETPMLRRLRTENLAGLCGRVLEVGAGTGTNFAFYPPAVQQVIALEPEIALAPKARQAAADAPVWAYVPSSDELPPASEQDVITNAIIYRTAAVQR
jgi:protein-L-isoaspartate O-methyltransferase